MSERLILVIRLGFAKSGDFPIKSEILLLGF